MLMGELVIPRDLSQCSADEVDEMAASVGRMCSQLAVFDSKLLADVYADGLIAGAAVMARVIRKSQADFSKNELAAMRN